MAKRPPAPRQPLTSDEKRLVKLASRLREVMHGVQELKLSSLNRDLRYSLRDTGTHFCSVGELLLRDLLSGCPWYMNDTLRGKTLVEEYQEAIPLLAAGHNMTEDEVRAWLDRGDVNEPLGAKPDHVVAPATEVA